MISIKQRSLFYEFTHNNTGGSSAVSYWINHNMGMLVQHARVVRTTGGTLYSGGDSNIPGYPQRWETFSGGQRGWLIIQNKPMQCLFRFHNSDDSVGVSNTYEVTLLF